jgi:hypothetical protein
MTSGGPGKASDENRRTYPPGAASRIRGRPAATARTGCNQHAACGQRPAPPGITCCDKIGHIMLLPSRVRRPCDIASVATTAMAAGEAALAAGALIGSTVLTVAAGPCSRSKQATPRSARSQP